jgi:hypothetical protein
MNLDRLQVGSVATRELGGKCRITAYTSTSLRLWYAVRARATRLDHEQMVVKRGAEDRADMPIWMTSAGGDRFPVRS